MVKSQNEKWIIVAYDLPSEPSKLRVRAWRAFKKLGALYPSVSLCILPDNPQTRNGVDELRSDFGKYGTILALNAGALSRNDRELLLQMFLEDRRKQYEEILEECQEFLDEIKENIGNKKVTYEETDELEQALEGLEKWYRDVREKGHGRERDAAKVESILETCRTELADFAERAQPKAINK
jgi:chromosome segregation ATPase